MKRQLVADGIGCLALVILAVIGLRWGERIKDIFRLSGEDTVYEYHTADVEDQIDFLMRMCHGGTCLRPIDWKCGFSTDDEEKVRDCFDATVAKSKPWVRLDTVRKMCGRQFASFTGERYGDPKECKRLGGRWGEKPPWP